MEHDLKCWPEFYDMKINGIKDWELRSTEDRKFEVGDILNHHKYDPETNKYLGGIYSEIVLNVVHGPIFGLKENNCIMSTRAVNKV